MLLKVFSSKEDLKNCNFIKTILLIMVVACHSMYFWDNNWFTVVTPAFSAPHMGILSGWLKSFNIYCFMLVSGYIFRYAKFEADKYRVYKEFLRNKILRLLVPYAFISIVWGAPIYHLLYHETAGDLFKRFCLGIGPGQLGFLLALFWIFAIFGALSDFISKYTLQGGFLMLIMWGMGILIPNYFQIGNALSYLPFFWLGFKIRQHGSVSLMKIPNVVWVVMDFLFYFILNNWNKSEVLIVKILQYGADLVLHSLGAVMAFTVMQKLAYKIPWSDNRVFKLLQRTAMPVFLIHQQIVYFVILALNGRVNPYVNAFLNFIVALLVSMFVSLILQHFSVTRRLIGER